MLTGKRSIHRARAITPARVLEIESGAFYRMAAEVPEVADVFISRLASRLRDTQRTFRQLEKMAALGKFRRGSPTNSITPPQLPCAQRPNCEKQPEKPNYSRSNRTSASLLPGAPH